MSLYFGPDATTKNVSGARLGEGWTRDELDNVTEESDESDRRKRDMTWKQKETALFAQAETNTSVYRLILAIGCKMIAP
jgi:hypothetical protein